MPTTAEIIAENSVQPSTEPVGPESISESRKVARLTWAIVSIHPRMAESLCNRLQLEFARRKHRLLYSHDRKESEIVRALCLLHTHRIAVAQCEMLTPEMISDIKREVVVLLRMPRRQFTTQRLEQLADSTEMGSFSDPVETPSNWLRNNVLRSYPPLKDVIVSLPAELDDFPRTAPTWKLEVRRIVDLPNIVPITAAAPIVTETTVSSASGVIRASEYLPFDDLFNAAITAATQGWKPRWAYGS